MSVRAATPELIGQKVRAVLEKRPHAQVIALRAEPHWSAGSLVIDGRRVVVEPCSSPLAVRATLCDWAREHPVVPTVGGGIDSELLVVLCDLTEAALGDDVLARFATARLEGLEPWSAARSLFGVRHLDAAFSKHDTWIADALLTHVPEKIARSMTAGGVLTIDVALDALANTLLGADHLSVDALLAAAAYPKPFTELASASPAVQEELLNALRRRQGPLAALVAGMIGAGRGSELLSLGLVARAVYGQGEHDGGRAAGRLEARCHDVRIAPAVGAAFAKRCEDVVVRVFTIDRDRANVIVAEAAALASEFDAAHPESSDFLPSGFDRRIAIAAGAIRTALDGLLPAASAIVTANIVAAAHATNTTVEQAGRHRQRETPSGRTRRAHLEMAARLTAWLTTPTASSISFEDAAASYASSSAWVDRARRQLWRGDADDEVGTTYRRLLDAVVKRRQVENEEFARRLATWTETPSGDDARTTAGVVAVEDVASTVLAPLAKSAPVLFVVLDGCGLPSFTELGPQLGQTGYREVVRTAASTSGGPAAARRLVGIAALPTVTEVSRASLIAGRLDRGNQDHERRAFGANAELKIGGAAPEFFHQNKLFGAAGSQLSAEVERALGPSGPPIVGVVINTIDDHLKHGTFTEELRIEDLHALVPLLDAARTHGRTVVISADHGHVLAQPEDGGTGKFQGGGSGGERWRVADRDATANEVVLRGERVLLGGDAGVIAPFDDDFRYGAKAGGYHGGATPEEVLVPVAVFTPAGMDAPGGWEYAAQVPPLWWDLLVERPVIVGGETEHGAAKVRVRKGKPVDESQGTIFEVAAPVQARPEPAAKGSHQPTWLASLLTSDVWKLQKGASGRAQLQDDRIRAVLSALARRGGVGSFAALSVDTGMPVGRLPGFLANLARILNVDGYPVLDIDTAGGEARLSTLLLAQQFEITVEPT